MLHKSSGTNTLLAIAFACGWLTCISVQAQIVITSQSRSVSADAMMACAVSPDSSSASSTTAGLFNQTVSEFMDGAEANLGGGICVYLNESFNGSATQGTTITGAMVQGSGSASAGKGGGANEFGNSSGDSILTIGFTVLSPTPYQLFGQVAGEQALPPSVFFPGDAKVELLMGTTPIHSVIPNAPLPFTGGGTDNPFFFSGVLAPGAYTLNAYASASASGSIESSDTASFNFTFVPEPASSTLLISMAAGILKRRRRSA